MSTERLSAKDFLGLYLMDHPFPDDPWMIQAAEAFAAQEVDQQTKQLREERDKAIILLRRMIASCDGYPEVLEGCSLELDINNFFNQLNQQKAK